MTYTDKLAKLNNKYFTKNFGQTEITERSYSKYRIPIGLLRSGKPYCFEFDDAIAAVIIGIRGSGKTFLLRGIADRAKKVGYAIFFCPDVKDEFKSSKKPLQEKFRKYLLKNEIPQAHKIVTLRPTFFKQLRDNKLPEDNFWYSPKISEIEKADFLTLLRAHSLSMPQQAVVDLLYEELEKSFKKGDIDISDIEVALQSLESKDFEITQGTRMSLLLKIRPLKSSYFIEKENAKSLIAAIQKGYSVAINMENFDHFGRGMFAYPEVVLSCALRTIIAARRAKKIPPLFVILDELSRFVHKKYETSFRFQLEESIDLDRAKHVSHLMATQEWDKVPEAIINQSRYFMIPFCADQNTFKTVLTAVGLIRNHQTAHQTVNKWRRQMQNHDWLVVDKFKNRADIVRALAPLSAHAESK